MVKLKSYWPVLALGFIVLTLAIANYSPGTFLTGGDNLHPEFNIWLNIKRSLFAVWQEYQGVGLLGGMGHASDLLRQVLLAVLGAIFPSDSLRYLITFLTLFIGATGAYFLIKNILGKVEKTQELLSQRINILSFLGASFYLFNLSTLQTYYVPFEVFTSHFAALPWLLLVSINYLRNKNKKNLAALILILILSTPSAYVPTLFLVFIMAISVLFPFATEGTMKNKVKSYVKYLAWVLAVNAFWILPFIFFTLTSSSININSKINQMATENIFLQNKEFGGIFDIMLLKGFWLNNVEPNLKGEFVYMLQPWRNHLNIFVSLIGYALFGAVIVGFFASLFRKNKLMLGFCSLFIFVVLMLTTSTPPFSIVNSFLRDSIPLFNQIFRFPFTKFSILASLVFALFFSLGIDYLITRFLNRTLKNYLLGLGIGIFALIIFCLPMFEGHLFYSREKITIPKEYFETFKFFEQQDKNTRIANFPQFSFWGWYFYRWGYSGSGFIWYGIEQPILDRNFDVWSNYNEAYYWELSTALYSKNSQQLKNVLNKYQVKWVLVDKNIINPSSYKSLFTGELEELLKKIPEIKKEKEFGNIIIYSFKPKDQVKKFVYMTGKLPTVNSYLNSAKDVAYSDFGNYAISENAEVFYPFRSLITSKNQENIEFSAVDKGDFLEFSKPLPRNDNPTILNIPSLINDNNMLSVELSTIADGASGILYMTLRSPSVSVESTNPQLLGNVDGEKLWEDIKQEEIFRFPLDQKYPLTINVNGVNKFTIEKKPGTANKLIARTSLSVDQPNLINLSDSLGKNLTEQTITGSFMKSWSGSETNSIELPPIPENTKLIVKVPKIKDQYQYQLLNFYDKVKLGQLSAFGNCDNFRKGEVSIDPFISNGKKWLDLSAKNSTACIAYYMPTLDHDQAYFIQIQHQNLTGRGLHVWILNEDQKVAPIDTYLPKGKGEQKSSLILPPFERFGKAYSIHFDNQSIGTERVENYLGDVTIYPIPSSFIQNLKLSYEKPSLTQSKLSFEVSHANPSIYTVTINKNGPQENNIVLSQAYNRGWVAFSGLSILPHRMINDWENGWEIRSDKSELKITIIYIPQFLEYLGLFFLLATVIYILIKANSVD